MAVCGQQDENLKRVESRLGVGIRVRGNQISLSGPDDAVERARNLLQQIYDLARKGTSIGIEEVERGIGILTGEPSASLADVMGNGGAVPLAGGRVVAKSIAQRAYIQAMQRNDMVFAIGPAGTGKTYLAMAMAIASLLAKKVKRIILTRPAVEAGERLGFLPGDLVEKINPYLRPLYDALYDLLDVERGNRLIEQGIIEIAPLAFMRGRTLSHAAVILDEAQNCTIEQMKMFLTRMGSSSRVVVTGDVTQTDLPEGRPSGLLHAWDTLRDIPGIAFCQFDERDVMRHPLVQEIIRAYGVERARRLADGTRNGNRAESPDGGA